MRKTIVLAIIACILGIVLLAALAFYIPNGPGRRDNVEESELFTGFQFQTENIRKENILSAENLPSDTLVSEEARQVKQTEETQAPVRKTDVQNVTSDMARLSDGAAAIPEHQIIWAGDSRTLGMRDALHKAGRTDEDIFVGKVGEGVHWFQEEGMAELSDAIAENPDLPVVLNFGVNDPQLIDEYVVTYWDLIRAHPDTQFYILSVNPIDEEFLIEDGQVNESVLDDINSVNIGRMNVKLRDEFGRRYINSAAMLKSDGFDTVDGLHFTMQTYLNIHDFVVNELF